MIKCPNCYKEFAKKQNLEYHLNLAKKKCTILNKKIHICELCDKTYVRAYTLKRHCEAAHGIYEPESSKYKITETIEQVIKNQEQIKLENKLLHDTLLEQLKLENKMLLEKLLEQQKKPSPPPPTNENITTNPFSQENLDCINDKEPLEGTDLKWSWSEFIINPYSGIPKMVKLIHFNPKYPENHNIISKSLEEQTVYLYDQQNTTFEIQDRDFVIEMAIQENAQRLTDYVKKPSEVDNNDSKHFLKISNEVADIIFQKLSNEKRKKTAAGRMINEVDKIIRDSHGKIAANKSLLEESNQSTKL